MQSNKKQTLIFNKKPISQTFKEELIKSFHLSNYFFENGLEQNKQKFLIPLEYMLDCIEKTLSLNIYKLITDIFNCTQKSSLIFRLPTTFTTDPKKKQYFDKIHQKLFKLEISECLEHLYKKVLEEYDSKRKIEPIQLGKQQTTKHMLVHSNSMSSTPKKSLLSNQDGKTTPKTPEKKSKKVSFHGEVTVQIFSKEKREAIKTEKKEERYKEKGRKVLSFMEFIENQEKAMKEVSQKTEGAKSLLKFIKGNNITSMISKIKPEEKKEEIVKKPNGLVKLETTHRRSKKKIFIYLFNFLQFLSKNFWNIIRIKKLFNSKNCIFYKICYSLGYLIKNSLLKQIIRIYINIFFKFC